MFESNKFMKGNLNGEIKGNKFEGVFDQEGKPSIDGTVVDNNSADTVLSVPGKHAKPCKLIKIGPLPEDAERLELSKKNLLKIAAALKEYKSKHGNRLPETEGAGAFEEMRQKGVLKDPNALICPGTKTRPPPESEPINEVNVDYVYCPPVDDGVTAYPIVWDRPDNFGSGCHALFSNGQIIWVDRNKLNQVIKNYK